MAVKIHVFYGSQYMGNETTVDDIKVVPDGAYICLNQKWYVMLYNSLTPINQSDLPAEVLAQMLLLGEQV